MLSSAMALSPENRHQFTVARMKRIGDPHPERRTAGIAPLD
jgi:hypothetical protein